MYEPELSTLGETERQQTLIAIESLIDFESWARMREFSGLSIEEAREVWVKSIDRLLPPTPRFLTLCAGKRRKAPLRGSDHGGGRSSGG